MTTPNRPGPPELWGGVECTVNRVRDRYLDQLEFSGHNDRPDDLDLFAALGLRALRYPVLWERTRPNPVAPGDWSWAAARLARLRALGIRPIVGLSHHGGGPPHTSLVASSFAEGLADFARATAERFPWLADYTPVNEPLTTARFSGLYGHWYPHRRDDLAFATALLNQCRAVVLAMRAIRRVNPAAQLVQTEDIGKIYATPGVAYQAEFENQRRWLSLDLLCGRVNRAHPMWGYLRWAGAPEAEVAWFLDNFCPPDIVGVNYYVTSDRFLDGRLEHYPPALHGGNGRDRYADVEAVRVRAEGITGAGAVLREAWERYRLPVAVTEAHLGCTREEQLRWLWEVWHSACRLREEGVDLRAVTAWSLLGAYDWDSLATCAAGHYEPGVFDLRADAGPRPTALAGMLRDLGAVRMPSHPALAGPGWWHRPERLLVPPVATGGTTDFGFRPPDPADTRPLLVAGATGTLGRAFGHICARRGLYLRLLNRAEMDISDPASVARVMDEFGPWAVINAAGYVRVDEAEAEPERCLRENALGPETLARACARRGAALLTFSSDLVFDGRRGDPYRESDPVAPLNVYGRSKAEAERRVREVMPGALVVRTSAFFGPWDRRNFVARALEALSAGRRFLAAEDMMVSPTYVPELAEASLDLLIDGERGVWHLANRGALSWAALARRAAALAALDPAGVEGRPAAALGWRAPRPAFSALGSERGQLLSELDDALERFLRRDVPACN
jgi:dTDP-4-dehydrorhamnose reductase